MTPSDQTAEILNRASRSLEAGDLATAESVLPALLERQPAEPDGLFLMGRLRQSQGRIEEAEQFFRRSLAIKAQQPDVQIGLAFALFSQGGHGEALAGFRAAIRMAPASAGAHFGEACVLHAMGRLAEAEAGYRNALRLRSDFAEAWQKLGSVLNDLGRPQEAGEVLSRALPHARNDRLKYLMEYTLGAALAQQGEHQEALARFDRAKMLAPDQAPVDHNRAVLLQNLGRDEEAVDIFRALVRNDPLNLHAHYSLNYLLYRMARDEEFLSSYDAAMAQRKQSPGYDELLAAKAQFLLQCGRAAEARDAYRRVLSKNPAHHVARIGLAAALERTQEYEAAVDACKPALSTHPDDPHLNASLAVALLCLREPHKAEPAAAKAVAADPTNQMALAILGLAWRMLGDERDEILNGYDSLIGIFDLEPPEGYSDMAVFNRDLDAVVKQLHSAGRGYIDQPQRGGTQSTGHLFRAKQDLVDRLRPRIEDAVGRYIAELPADPEHPLARRRNKGFAFAGSWSSRLGDAGFITNHVHPRGWISSAYYVAVPEVSQDCTARQGWIKFGEPCYAMDLSPRRVVQPVSGRLILFPSYMWHGTAAFHALAHRTSISFDAVPSGNRAVP